jgi:hypothetical protein
MLRRVAVALLLTALLAMPALADGPRDERRAMRQEAMERWDALNQTQREQGLARAEAHGLFARLTFAEAKGQATGGYLRFQLDARTGTLQDVRVRANRTLALVPLLASVTPTPFTAEGGPEAHGAMLRMDGANVDFTAHNNPTAALTWHASAATNLTFTLAPGLQAFRPDTTETREVRILVGATHAHIASNGGPIQLSTGNRTVTVALAAGDSVALRIHPVGDTQAGGLHDQLAAFRLRKLGATLRVADAGGAAAEDGESTDVEASTREIHRGRVVWDISSAQHQGRLLFLTLDNGTLDVTRLGQATVTLNGTALRVVGKVADVLAATDGAYVLVASDDHQTVTLAVAVPHFSAYALALTQPLVGGASAGGSSDSGSSGSTSGATRGTPGLAAGTLLAVGLALLLARRRA